MPVCERRPVVPCGGGPFRCVCFVCGQADGDLPRERPSQAQRRATPRQVRSASALPVGLGHRATRLYDAETGRQARCRHRQQRRSRLTFAAADQKWLSLQKKRCRPASEIARTYKRRARSGYLIATPECGLSRTAWSSSMRPGPPQKRCVYAAFARGASASEPRRRSSSSSPAASGS